MMRAVTAREQSDQSNSEKNSELIESIFKQIEAASKNGSYDIKIKEELDRYTWDYFKSIGYNLHNDHTFHRTIISW